MNEADFQLRYVGDPRLAAYATSLHPAWLWSSDGTRIWWANPVGARLLGAANGEILSRKIFGPADPHRRQVAQLAGRLSPDGAIRMERLRGFGARLGLLATCGCARLDFADGATGILITGAETPGPAMPLVERLQLLVEDAATAMAAFTRDGLFVGASAAAGRLFGFHSLAEAGLEEAYKAALELGHAEASTGSGQINLQRVGNGAETGLIALMTADARLNPQSEPAAASPPAAPPEQPAPPAIVPSAAAAMAPSGPEYEQPALSGEAPAEFALVDEFQEFPAGPAEESSAPESQSELQSPAHAEAAMTTSPEIKPSWLDEPAPEPRHEPLRFVWRMDSEGRFQLGNDEFTHLIGTRTAAGFGRPWSEIAKAFGLDPEGRVARAVATHDTWSGITLNWPVDGGDRLPVELSGLPVFDRAQNFAGYRGFGICRDIDALSRLAVLRHHELLTGPPPQALSADVTPVDPDANLPLPEAPPTDAVEPLAVIVSENSSPTHLELPVQHPKNVLPFRPINESKAPALTPVENSAFDELARQLSARLDNETEAPPTQAVTEVAAASPAAPQPPAQPAEAPEWLARPEPPPRGEARRDKALLDLMPVGILIYRLDRLVYANHVFLDRMGYASLQALEEAGGLDALFVEPGVSSASSTSDTGTPVTISASGASPGHAPSSATAAHLFTIEWDGESALALILSGAATENPIPAMPVEPAASPPSAVGHANAEELGAILDTTAEGIVMFDAEGNINSCNRSAEALFGYDGAELVRRNLTELFAPESQRVVLDYLASMKGTGVAGLLEHGRDALGRVSKGGVIPLSITMGRTRPDGPNFFAVFRDLSQSRQSENELQQAQRLADRAANAKADMLAHISHEVRTPLNAIIGFAEVMIRERFGSLGNERYVEYMKDIRASGQRVVAIIDDLLDLSRIETGKLDLAFANQNLNDLVESCVGVMQPQANRERIIIRTSLAHTLPPVVADARALRQIALNLIGNSIHLANAGGQVIVSTALSDFGEVVLRVRDTGHGLNDNEVAAAMEPFRTPAPSDQASDSSGVSLSLTKALVEANRAQFNIKTGPHSGTLIEVVFAHAAVAGA